MVLQEFKLLSGGVSTDLREIFLVFFYASGKRRGYFMRIAVISLIRSAIKIKKHIMGYCQ